MSGLSNEVRATIKSTLFICFVTYAAAALSLTVWVTQRDFGSGGFLMLIVTCIVCVFISAPPFFVLLLIHFLLRKKSTPVFTYLLSVIALLNLYLLPFYLLVQHMQPGLLIVMAVINFAFLAAHLLQAKDGHHPIINFSSFKQIITMETSFNAEPHEQQAPNLKAGRPFPLIKIVVLTVMALALFLCTGLVRDLIEERETHQNVARAFFENSWGGSQILSGPFISIPYKVRNKDGVPQIRYAHLMPRQLNAEVILESFERKQGIYTIPVYRAQQQIKGYFELRDLQSHDIPAAALEWDRASLCFGFSDAGALEYVEGLMLNGNKAELEAGLPTQQVSSKGVSTEIILSGLSRVDFEANIAIKGTEKIAFVPIGKNTEISIQSNWPSPSFFGKSLPNERPETGSDGFSGKWKVQHLNRGFPQAWVGESQNIYEDAFGVSLKQTVNQYTLSERIVKYALLVIGLVFTVFFFTEMLRGKYIHPVQYLLVGLALCLFYSLMVGFSEHMAFALAYWIAALMTTGLIAGFIRSVLQSNRAAGFSFLSLTAIYGFMYLLLLQEDYALVLGNIGLFTVLGTVMYLSRRIQWSAN